jgi:hypothetical protein
LFLIGFVLAVESLGILLIISQVTSFMPALTVAIGWGYVIFKIFSGIVAMLIGIEPFRNKRKKKR